MMDRRVRISLIVGLAVSSFLLISGFIIVFAEWMGFFEEGSLTEVYRLITIVGFFIIVACQTVRILYGLRDGV